MRLLQDHVRGRLPTLAALLLLAGGVGCSGGRYPVSGKVVYPDGTPVTEGLVLGVASDASGEFTAQGVIMPDGTFRWGMDKPKDGAKPGMYRVTVVGPVPSPAEEGQGKLPGIDSKYANPETSGIDFEVKTSGTNELNITVTPPRRRR